MQTKVNWPEVVVLLKIKSATELRQERVDPAARHNTRDWKYPIGLNVNLIDDFLFGFKSFRDIYLRAGRGDALKARNVDILALQNGGGGAGWW